MNVKGILKAYGYWLAGVLSCAGAFYFLYRSRTLSYDLEAGLVDGTASVEGLQERIGGYVSAGDDLLADPLGD